MNSYHFLGYWGYGIQDDLDAYLDSYVNYHSRCVNPIWNVALVGSLSVSTTSYPTIAALSAGGIDDYPDVWVRLDSDTRLSLGRDGFGRVPLYWMQQGQVIWFASQLKLLLPILNTRQINTSAVYGYSCFSYVPTPLTPVTGIHAVNPGEQLTWHYRDEAIILQPSQRLREWQEAAVQVDDEAIAVKELQVLLKNAIEYQIQDIKDETVGITLSGGLDSSIIASLLVQAGVKVKAYTLDFGDFGIPEYPYAQQVAQYLNIPLVKVDASPRHIQKALIPTVKALDLPFGDGVTVPLYLLAQRASDDVRVIFNGENGDQLFAGWTNKPLIAAGIYQGQHPNQENFIQQYLRTFHRLWGYESSVYQFDVNQFNAEDWLQTALDSRYTQTLLHRLRRGSLMLKGAQNIQPRATNIALSQGLVVRSPFCDLPMTEWTFRLSGKLILQGSCEKYILKRAVEDWLPAEIVWRQKRGMGVPTTSWCLNHFWHKLGDWLNPGTLDSGGIFQPDIPAKIVSGQLSAAITGRRIGEILWLLVMWELWRIHVLGEIPNQKQLLHSFILPRRMWRYLNQWQA